MMKFVVGGLAVAAFVVVLLVVIFNGSTGGGRQTLPTVGGPVPTLES